MSEREREKTSDNSQYDLLKLLTIEKRLIKTLAFFLMIMYASTAVSSNRLNISEFYMETHTHTHTQTALNEHERYAIAGLLFAMGVD